MRRVTRGMLAGVVAGIALAATAGTAAAEERVCRGAIGASTVDNLRVPDGATCRLSGTVVQGTVSVGSGARLIARGIRVVGNVQAEGHRAVTVVLSRVGGSVQLVQGRAANVSRNSIGSDLQAFENRGTQTFRANRIDGNLQCKENVRRPVGGGNVVEGNREDQCSRL